MADDFGTTVPGSRGLDADLHSAALRELGLDQPMQRQAQARQAEPELAPPAVSRADLNDWLDQFAPVVDPDEDASTPSRARGSDSPSARRERPESNDPEFGDPEFGDPGGSDDRPTDLPAPQKSAPGGPSDAAIASYGPPQGPRLNEILQLNEAHIPGINFTPSAPPAPAAKPPVLAVDWNAPLVWSNDQSSDPMSLEKPAPATGPNAAPSAERSATTQNGTDGDSTDGDSAHKDAADDGAPPGPPPWPAPPPLDEAGVPVMTPITSWTPTEPVAWGWAEAWPDGAPVDWHTQSLPAVPEAPLVATISQLDERPPPPPPPPGGRDTSAETDSGLALDTPTTGTSTDASAASTEGGLPDGVSDSDEVAALDIASPSASTPVRAGVPTRDSIAWAEDLPLPEDRPAPPDFPLDVDTPIPGMTPFAGSGFHTAGPQADEWNAAIADEGQEFAAPAPPAEWLDAGLFDEVDGQADDSTQLLPGGADSQSGPSPYHEPVTPDGAGADDLPGSNNVDHPQHGGGSEPGETPPSLDPVFTDWAPASAEPTPGAAAPMNPAPAPASGYVAPSIGTIPEAPVVSSPNAFDPAPEPPLFAAAPGSPQTHIPNRLEAPRQDSVPPRAPVGIIAQLRANPATRLLLEWVPLLIGAFIVAMVVRMFVFQAYYIPSGSMIPTLEVRDRVLVNKLSYNFHDVNRGDIMVFKRPEGTDGTVDDLIKRVIGLPGETLNFRNGNVYVDGQLVEESYLQEQDSTFPIAGIPGCVPAGTSSECTVPEGHVFVLGDNRRGSTDGRVFGPIPTDTIVGRAFVKVWPLGEIGLM